MGVGYSTAPADWAMSISVCLPVYIYIYIYIRVFVCVHLCVRLCVCVCLYRSINMYKFYNSIWYYFR